MIQLRTQTAEYWERDYRLTSQDVSYVYDRILDRGAPMSLGELAAMQMERISRREQESLQADLSRGSVYQPKDLYQVGDTLIFPALDLALGKVVSTRVGRNPEYGEFTVIRVQMEGGDKVREFASGLSGNHALNRTDGQSDLLASADLLSGAELTERYGAIVEQRIAGVLEKNEAFARFRGEWFVRDMLVPIGPGHLNIAEALIEVKGKPLPTPELAADLDLPAEVSEEIRNLSVNFALQADERFDNVGDSGRDIWYLRRLTPEQVVNPPIRLAISSEPYDRRSIAPDLLLVEREIDDEGSVEAGGGPPRPVYRLTMTLSYPHWRAGTLPLTARTRGMFPEATARHSPVVLIDGQTGDRMQGWVVPGAGFVYGLEAWYRRHNLPAGTVLKLERARDPRVITVDFEPQRLQGLWFKIAAVQNGKLTFQMRKQQVACRYDDLMAIGGEDAEALDQLWTEVDARGDSLFEIMVDIMPELVKLSPQGTVHAKTIYSAVNILKRTPPGPIFALLTVEPCFEAVGGGYWTFDPVLVGS